MNLPETPGTPSAVSALVTFASVLAADRFIGEALRAPVDDEKDAFHQLIALSHVGAWVNGKAMGDYFERVKRAVADKAASVDAGQ
jgi:hypothetical protein